MKKILLVLIGTLALSIVVFGFRRSNAVLQGDESSPMQSVRFTVSHVVNVEQTLPVRLRIIDNDNGVVAHDVIKRLYRKDGRYITAPMLLEHGSYRVEAIIQMDGGITKTYVNNSFTVSVQTDTVSH